jgi:hypothetical protein
MTTINNRTPGDLGPFRAFLPHKQAMSKAMYTYPLCSRGTGEADENYEMIQMPDTACQLT